MWKVADFGAFKSASALSASAAPAAPATRVTTSGGNGAESTAVAHDEPEVAKQVPLRVPFGRGPKDRSVELERRDKVAERPPRHNKPPHKRRRR